jgi:hypothetical protein
MTLAVCKYCGDEHECTRLSRREAALKRWNKLGGQEMKRLALVVITGFWLTVFFWLAVGHAQLPTQIQPNGTGGYSIYTPGQLPTQVEPNGTGGYNVYAPPIQQGYAPPVYERALPPMGAPYMPRGAEPFNGQSAGQMMYGR